jgi:hypothetical protein
LPMGSCFTYMKIAARSANWLRFDVWLRLFGLLLFHFQ